MRSPDLHFRKTKKQPILLDHPKDFLMPLFKLSRTCLPILLTLASVASASPLTYDYTGNFETFTVTPAGIYNIIATGAQGGDGQNGAAGFAGARIGGDFTLTVGEILRIAVGGRGGESFGFNNPGGGGGGSFVIASDGTALVIAGGGGGANVNGGSGGQAGTAGADGAVDFAGAGGTNGNGGTGAVVGGGGGGGGFLTGGTSSPLGGGGGGKSYLDGLAGVPGFFGAGGFGGGGAGGAGSGLSGGGGGGGYSGGGGGGIGIDGGGGGGGSFNADLTSDDRMMLSAVNFGDGEVVINFLSASAPAGVPEPGVLPLIAAALFGLRVAQRRRAT